MAALANMREWGMDIRCRSQYNRRRLALPWPRAGVMVTETRAMDRERKTERILAACVTGLLPFVVLPNVSDFVNGVVLPDGTPLQRQCLDKLLLAILAIAVGFSLFGPRRLGYLGRPILGTKGVWYWVLPAVYIAVNFLQGGPLRWKNQELGYLLGWALAVGVWEETVFRGIMFQLLRPIGARTFVVISSVWFAVVHIQLGAVSVIHAAVIGLSMATAYAATPTILPAIAIHFGINLSSRLMAGGNPYFDTIAMVATVGIGLVSSYLVWRLPAIAGDDPSMKTTRPSTA
jgi:membrane protease YdiL (CAAX protease family)